MNKFLIILKPKDKTYRTEEKPLPGGTYEAKNGYEAMDIALKKFGKPAKVIWAERRE